MNDPEAIRLLTEIRDALRRTIDIQEAMAERQRRAVKVYLVVLVIAGALLAVIVPMIAFLTMGLLT